MDIYKKSKYFIKFLVFLILLPFILIKCSCGGNATNQDIGKPNIRWINYDYDDGLGNPKSSVSNKFETEEIPGGVFCQDINVKTDGNSKTIWLGTGIPLLFSNDMGETWKVVEESIPYFEGVRQIRIDSQGTIWIASPCSILRSIDNGITWEQIYQHKNNVCAGIERIAIRDNELWVACTNIGIIVKININTLETKEIYYTNEKILSILPASNGNIYIATKSELKVSYDGGYTFVHFYTFTLPEGGTELFEINNTIWCRVGWEVIQLSLEGELLWRSSENSLYNIQRMYCRGNIIWGIGADENEIVLTRINTALDNSIQYLRLEGTEASSIYVDDDGVIYIGLPGNIAISFDNGQTWIRKPFGISTVSTIVSVNNHAWAGLYGVGAARYLPNFNTWETIGYNSLHGGLGLTIDSIYMRSSKEVFFGGGCDPFISITKDGGKSFFISQYDEYPPNDKPFGCTDIQEDSTGAIYLAVPYNPFNKNNEIRVYKSLDDGETWLGPDIVYSGPDFPHWPTVIVDEARNTIWVTTILGLFKKEIGGNDWLKEAGFGEVFSSFLDKENNLYITGEGPFGNGLYILKDSSSDWIYIEMPSEVQQCTVSFFVDNDGDYWLGSYSGLYYSPDEGNSWYRYSKEDGLASQYITSVFVEGSTENRVVWAGTVLGASKGIFKDVLIHLTSVTIESDNPNPTRAKVGDTVILNFTASEELLELPLVTIAGQYADEVVDLGNNSYSATRVMQEGDPEGTVKFTIDYKDTAGRPGNQVTEITSGSNVIFDKTPPVLSDVTITSSNTDPTVANVGDTVTLSFTASEELSELPVVTIAAQYADEVVDLGNNNYSATRVMQEGDPEGIVEFTIDYSDLAGNAGIQVTNITSGSDVIFMKN